MAYRKLLTQKTYDELKYLGDKCESVKDNLSDLYSEFEIVPSIVIGGDEMSRFKVEIKHSKKKTVVLYGKDINEILVLIEAFVCGIEL